MSEFDAGPYYPLDVECLPPGWEKSLVGKVVSDVQPGFPCGTHNDQGVGVPHLRPMNIDRKGRLDLGLVRHVPPDSPTRVRRGDVLFNNTNSPELVGKTTTIEQDSEFAFSNHMTRLRPSEGISPAFLAHQLHYLWMSGYFRYRCTHHVNQASISSRTLADSVPILLPPTAEQRRVVDEIEKNLTRLESAESALKRLQTSLKRYHAAVLKAACEGRLVPTEAELARAEGRDYEPAEQLLARILNERRARWEAEHIVGVDDTARVERDRKAGSGYEEPVPADAAYTPDLPRGWTIASMDALTIHITSGSRDWSRYYGAGSGTFLMAQNVRPDRLDLTYRQPVDPPRDDTSRTRSEVKKGDLLVTIVGANTGNVCPVVGELHEHYVCQSVALMRPVEPELSPFLTLYMNSEEHGQRQYRRYIYGAGRPHLSFDQLKMTPVCLPPISEQHRIVAEVECRLSVIDELEGVVEVNLKRAVRLRQAVLKRAFEGKLVPQDPNDEPASVLLEGIRRERAAKAADGQRPGRQRGAQNIMESRGLKKRR